MEITVNVSNYLTEDEIKEIAIEELRNAFARQFRVEADVERVLANLSHEYVFHAVCEQLEKNTEDVEQTIKNKIAEALNDSSTIKWKVFQRKDAWERSESPAVAILDDVLKNCKPKIEDAVNKRIEEYPFYELTEEISDTIYECIMKKMFDRRTE